MIHPELAELKTLEHSEYVFRLRSAVECNSEIRNGTLLLACWLGRR
jgi:hypothetical protein